MAISRPPTRSCTIRARPRRSSRGGRIQTQTTSAAASSATSGESWRGPRDAAAARVQSQTGLFQHGRAWGGGGRVLGGRERGAGGGAECRGGAGGRAAAAGIVAELEVYEGQSHAQYS